MQRYHVAAAICGSLIVATLSTAAPAGAEAPPAWLYATVGTRALLGTDGEDVPVAIVYETAGDYKAMISGKTVPDKSCGSRPEGTVIVIDAIVPEGATAINIRRNSPFMLPMVRGKATLRSLRSTR
jgi:hypothetical protein